GEAARALGADWRSLSWEGPKPAAGLPSAARDARHALLADAARQAGGRVILMAHTADDIAESDWMRAQGATLGALRDWSPSPAWPEGRGVMLLRPLLTTSRADLRGFLTARNVAWLEDPANADTRFLRSRARMVLQLEGSSCRSSSDFSQGTTSVAAVKAAPMAWSGLLLLPRAVPARILSAALLSVSGQTTPPRGARLAALHARLSSGADVTATLSGARLQTSGETLLITREPGRTGLPRIALPQNAPAVWDNRFEVTAPGPGWRMGPLQGRMAALAPEDQAIVRSLPASARPALPVLFRDEDSRPVLAWRVAGTRCLVADRLVAAVGGIGHEDQLTHSSGETPPADLFLDRRGG
ncbi:MAG: tRNA lysidine(34) synthetase, partial [Brevundimonas sp.]|uniref:tRNA lysidine(34) synthetase n=1 Tax=Brevundimonas sp. TaxID=1871086 RepID=UPI003919F905